MKPTNNSALRQLTRPPLPLLLLLLLLLQLTQLSSAAISSLSAAQQAADSGTAAAGFEQQEPRAWHAKEPAGSTHVLERFSHRYPDGSYEYRFELSDGTARYERGYFTLVDDVKTLMVVGYYSYRMPDNRYITVFYNADQFGYRQNQSITPQVYPNLPRSIEVPAFDESALRRQPVGHKSGSHGLPTSTPRASYYSSSTALPRGRY